LLHYR